MLHALQNLIATPAWVNGVSSFSRSIGMNMMKGWHMSGPSELFHWHQQWSLIGLAPLRQARQLYRFHPILSHSTWRIRLLFFPMGRELRHWLHHRRHQPLMSTLWPLFFWYRHWPSWVFSLRIQVYLLACHMSLPHLLRLQPVRRNIVVRPHCHHPFPLHLTWYAISSMPRHT